MSREYYFVCGILLVIVGIISLMSFSINEKTNAGELFYYRNHPAQIVEILEPDLTIKEGYVSKKEETVKIIRDGNIVAYVKLSKPVVVAQADKEEKWGFFQFPFIVRTNNNELVVCWQMNSDSHKSYGKTSLGKKISFDEGHTWKPLDKGYVFSYKSNKDLELKNGNTILTITPISKAIKNYVSFPKPVYRDESMNMDYYFEAELPDELRGLYLRTLDGHGERLMEIHGIIDDPGLLRYDIGGLMPVKWWGDMKELADGSLVAGIYPSCYLNSNNETPKSDVTFYRSSDGGYHWKSIGRIHYNIEKLKDRSRQYDRYQGFSEASYVILKDSTFFCVMRTGYNTPLYKSYSHDKGVHWTEPVAFTPNGVKPQLLLLGNGIMVMASGRPGVQLRFCLDGDGEIWTEPIEMLPYIDEKGCYNIWGNSCGYASLLQVDVNTFYMVYSDFTSRKGNLPLLKSIVFRKFVVERL